MKKTLSTWILSLILTGCKMSVNQEYQNVIRIDDYYGVWEDGKIVYKPNKDIETMKQYELLKEKRSCQYTQR